MYTVGTFPTPRDRRVLYGGGVVCSSRECECARAHEDAPRSDVRWVGLGCMAEKKNQKSSCPLLLKGTKSIKPKRRARRGFRDIFLTFRTAGAQWRKRRGFWWAHRLLKCELFFFHLIATSG